MQLAEPYGDGLLLVVRVWTEKKAEFRVLRLTTAGAADDARDSSVSRSPA